jgi:DUF1680 family protein
LKINYSSNENKSPYRKLFPVAPDAVRLKDHFWAPRIRLLSERTLLTQYQQLEITGRISNFERVVKDLSEPFRGLYFNESDVYKWLEAAAYSLAQFPNEYLKKLVVELVNKIIAIQQPDGYLNAYFVGEKAHLRWTDLQDKHELYCAGHLIEAAIAVHRSIGDDTLLAAAIRYANLIVDTFGVSGKIPHGAPGHPEIELALVALFRYTGDKQYLTQALRFIDNRGYGHLGYGEYYQDHKPVRELQRMYGHAVRAVYLNAGVADVFSETGDKSLLKALEVMWQHMTNYQMYVTGGIGSRDDGEAFGADYELPDAEAYAETCAAIGKIFWDWRMLLITGDAKYADDLEITLFNAMLAGIGLDGASYHYSNPLASDCMHRRQPWFAISCCPPNIARVLASLPGYLYTTSEEGLWIHLYAESACNARLPDGTKVQFEQTSSYPWDGQIRLKITNSADFALFLRIPAWCNSGASLSINGEMWAAPFVSQSYVRVYRQWQSGDVVELNLPMPVQQMIANPNIQHLMNRVALTSGPIVFCLEHIDEFMPKADNFVLSPRSSLNVKYAGKELGNVKMIEVQGIKGAELSPGETAPLYERKFSDQIVEKNVNMLAIPYFAWGNRDYGNMQVWLRRS